MSDLELVIKEKEQVIDLSKEIKIISPSGEECKLTDEAKRELFNLLVLRNFV